MGKKGTLRSLLIYSNRCTLVLSQVLSLCHTEGIEAALRRTFHICCQLSLFWLLLL